MAGDAGCSNEAMNIEIYSRDECSDSVALRRLLDEQGVEYRVRPVDGDARARREWENLGGTVTPLMVIDKYQVVRGLDQIQVAQHLGWIGC